MVGCLRMNGWMDIGVGSVSFGRLWWPGLGVLLAFANSLIDMHVGKLE